MTVMQHERGAVGGFSKEEEVAEDKDKEEDVLSCLRQLHRTLQECHWRVEIVDNALCTQGNKTNSNETKKTALYESVSQSEEGSCYAYTVNNALGLGNHQRDKVNKDGMNEPALKDNVFQSEEEGSYTVDLAVSSHPDSETNRDGTKETAPNDTIFWSEERNSYTVDPPLSKEGTKSTGGTKEQTDHFNVLKCEEVLDLSVLSKSGDDCHNDAEDKSRTSGGEIIDNQTVNDPVFQLDKRRKNDNVRSQSREGRNSQDESMTNNDLQSAGLKHNYQEETKDRSHANKQIRNASEQTKDNSDKPPAEPKESYCINHKTSGDEIKSESPLVKDNFHQNQIVAQEEDSTHNVSREDKSIQPQNGSNDNVSLDADNLKEHPPGQSIKDNVTQSAISVIDQTNLLYHPTPDHCSNHNLTKENIHKYPLINSSQKTSTRDLNSADFLRCLVRQDGMDGGDSVPQTYFDAAATTMESVHNLSDSSVNTDPSSASISSVTFPSATDVHSKFPMQQSKTSDYCSEESSSECCSQSSVIKHRPSHKEDFVGSGDFMEKGEGKEDIEKSQRTHPEPAEKGDEDNSITDGTKPANKESPDNTLSEVTQKMDVIWDALETLHSHFLVLHSSLVDSSARCLKRNLGSQAQEKPRNKHEEDQEENHYHSTFEGDSSSSTATGKMTLTPLSQTIQRQSQSFQRQISSETEKRFAKLKLNEPVYDDEVKPDPQAPTHYQEVACQAELSEDEDGTVDRKNASCVQGWRGDCLFVGLVLLLLLLLLFFASCLLLVVPIVNVSIRSVDGGFTAF